MVYKKDYTWLMCMQPQKCTGVSTQNRLALAACMATNHICKNVLQPGSKCVCCVQHRQEDGDDEKSQDKQGVGSSEDELKLKQQDGEKNVFTLSQRAPRHVVTEESELQAEHKIDVSML